MCLLAPNYNLLVPHSLHLSKKVLRTPEVLRVYIGSFWDEPLVHEELAKVPFLSFAPRVLCCCRCPCVLLLLLLPVCSAAPALPASSNHSCASSRPCPCPCPCLILKSLPYPYTLALSLYPCVVRRSCSSRRRMTLCRYSLSVSAKKQTDTLHVTRLTCM